ncbi:FK506-binding protein-like [Phaenicophaeus curvirostris]|uniref:FK506-binding protein-like n=1 Tax=Phaenicophaeus curvirostris TaxID=33595 RepID=UPI0037F0D84C
MLGGERALLRPRGSRAALGVALDAFTPAPPFWTSSRASRWERALRSGRRAAALAASGATEAAAAAYGRAIRWAVLAGGADDDDDVTSSAAKAELHAGLSLCQLELGLAAAAATNASKALELRPGDAEARVRRAAAAAALGDLEAALDDLRRVLREQPEHPRARRELQRVRGAARERDARLARRLARLFA